MKGYKFKFVKKNVKKAIKKYKEDKEKHLLIESSLGETYLSVLDNIKKLTTKGAAK